MKKENTSIRLKKIMQKKDLRQVDILELCKPLCEKYGTKMNKSDISQYVSGKVEPNQEKLFILGNALKVSEAWLMGFDVPMERISNNNNTIPFTTSLNIQCETESECNLIEDYRQLNEQGQKEARKRVSELTELKKYQLKPTLIAAHERTDIETTDQDSEHDLQLMLDPKNWK